MKAFGIEIRRTGQINDLYSDVDACLNKFNIETKQVSKEVQTLSIAHSLQKMISVQNYFCVCTVKTCSEISQIQISKERMDIYQSQHCVHYSEMTPEFRQVLIAMVLDDFRPILNPTNNE